MRLLIEIPDEYYNAIKAIPDIQCTADMLIIKSGIPQETVTEFADRCRECGARYGKTLKRYIEKDIEMLNEIIESGWLISDLEKCPAIDACEDAITALKQYPVLDKVRAEIEQLTSRYSISKERGGMGQVEWSDRLIKESEVLQIIDKYKAESEE